ncbi:MAG TPA: EamA family transporter, partial [Solirubrobacteraceae bacterium]|nr:EamA family transporter [Solirubrobacteraceae bacterium]
MSRSQVPWPARFALLALFWGSTFLFIKIGDEALAPIQVSLARLVIGTTTLLAIVALRGERLPAGWRLWGQLAIAGLLLNVAPFTLFAYGERHVSSLLAGIWNATVPLFTLPIAIAWIADEHASARRLLGLAIGFAGVLVVLGAWRGLGGASLAGNLLCLGAAASYGLGFPYTRRYLARRPEGPLSLAAAQLICATVEIAVLALLFTHPPSGLAAKHILSVLALGVFGTGLTFVLNYSLIRDVGATTTATVAYVMPIVSTLLGIVALGEPLRWYEPVGAAIIVVGAILAQSRGRPGAQAVTVSPRSANTSRSETL